MNKNLLIKLYQEKPASKIAKDHNLRPSKIQSLLRLYNIPKPYRNKEGKALDEKLIISLYHEQGKPIKEICTSFNASYDMISSILKKTIEIPIEDLQNLALNEIELKYGVKENTILELKAKHNLLSNPLTIEKEALEKEFKSLTAFQIAKKYQVSTIFVTIKLKEYGILHSINIEDLKRLYCIERKPIKQITEELKVSETTLWRLIKRHNLKRIFKPNFKEFFKLWHNKKITQEENIKVMADFYNVSSDMIRMTAKRLNIIKRDHIINIDDPEKLKELYRKHGLFGLTIILKKDSLEVKRILGTHGINKNDFDLNIISNLYQTKYLHLKNQFAIQEIAKDLNVKPTNLYKFIRLNKLTR